MCCHCHRDLPDGPDGPQALPAPNGRRLQHDPDFPEVDEDSLYLEGFIDPEDERSGIYAPPHIAEEIIRTLRQRRRPN